MDVDVFLGNLEDKAFNYDNGEWTGNIPTRISNFFPEPHKAFKFLLEEISNQNIIGKQTDWGAWVAIMYPVEIAKLFGRCYDKQSFAILKGILGELDENKQYGLVACEMS